MKRWQTGFLRHTLPLAFLLLAACGKPVPKSDGPAAVAGPQAASVPLRATTPVPAGDAPSPDDLAVTARLKSAFQRDPEVRALDLQVITTKGDARLIGRVDRADQKDRAITLARSIAGVRSIHDDVTLKP